MLSSIYSVSLHVQRPISGIRNTVTVLMEGHTCALNSLDASKSCLDKLNEGSFYPLDCDIRNGQTLTL